MSILWTIIIGFLAGLVARAVMPGKDTIGFFITALLGIAGAFVGAFVGQTAGWASPGQPVDFFGSVMGSLVILFVARLIARPRPS